jgi:hypothetical protein
MIRGGRAADDCRVALALQAGLIDGARQSGSQASVFLIVSIVYLSSIRSSRPRTGILVYHLEECRRAFRDPHAEEIGHAASVTDITHSRTRQDDAFVSKDLGLTRGTFSVIRG